MEIPELKHVRKSLAGGGQVVVLNTGAVIGAEAEAMLQALHSRSLGGIDAHLVSLAKKGAENFMASFYVGYGHKSIGDCGSITIFVEGVSMLAAKAIQHSPLYSGQESSTRYIDFASQAFIDPIATPASHALLESLRNFYLQGVARMTAALAAQYPRNADEDEKTWQKAINARAFDVMRSFLPAGAATNLAWHANLRQVADHLQQLRHHPLDEVRAVAEAIEQAVHEQFPSSFSSKRYEETEQYVGRSMRDYYHDPKRCTQKVVLTHDGIDYSELAGYADLLESRPAKTELPKRVAGAGDMAFEFLLDFGSFRDLQRQRAVHQRMPLLSTRFEFNEWYFGQMPDDLREDAKRFLALYIDTLEGLSKNTLTAQYYIPMGYNVPNRLSGDIHALTYLVELRTGATVHPTLRVVAHEMGAILLSKLAPLGYVLHLDDTPDRFNYKRGTHDIVEKVPCE